MTKRINSFYGCQIMNVLSIDLESWTHKYFLDLKSDKKNKVDNGYIKKATEETLRILKKYNVKTTFFVVSEIYGWYPNLINKIRQAGHEIGFQSHTHQLLTTQKRLKEELKLGQDFIDEFGPEGFRAPQGQMKKEYLPIIKDWGFKYDSSVYAPFKIYEPISGLFEAPVSTYPRFRPKEPLTYPRDLTLKLMVKETPFGSGYFIGLLGKNVQRYIRKLNKLNIPANLIIHNWQITEIPKLTAREKNINNILTRIKMFPYEINRRKDFKILLNRNKFEPLVDLIKKFK